jgi:hypothetical protein
MGRTKTRKDEELKTRVTAQMKARVIAYAAERGESESVVVREALASYFAKLEATSAKDDSRRARLEVEQSRSPSHDSGNQANR